ncbi:hypothetical protein B0H19DRAFT_1104732 [Mycena capillaripes]|nr:hypothetical protein B0H19DRAFT_1104732 [Mycena capillaripes]
MGQHESETERACVAHPLTCQLYSRGSASVEAISTSWILHRLGIRTNADNTVVDFAELRRVLNKAATCVQPSV